MITDRPRVLQSSRTRNREDDWTGVGVKCAEDLKVAAGPELTGDLNMENGKTETEDMMEGVSKA